MHDEVLSSSGPAKEITNKEYTNKSLWKEDEKYINNVRKVFDTYADKNYFSAKSGEIYWDYALTMGTFDESFLEVPVVKNGKINYILLVYREKDRVYFKRKEDENSKEFFNVLVFKDRRQLEGRIVEDPSVSNGGMQGKGSVCYMVEVRWTWTNADGSPGETFVYHHMRCTFIGPAMPTDDIYPGGGSGGGGGGVGGGYPYPEVPEHQSICEKAKAAVTASNNMYKDTKVQQNMDAVLKGKITAGNEWMVAVGQQSDGTYEVTPPREGTDDNGSIPASQLASTYIGDGHSHSGSFGTPSAGDLYGMLEVMLTNSNFKYRFVYGNYHGTPEVYVLIIDDRNLGINFLASYPRSENYDPSTHSFSLASPVGVEFSEVNEKYGEGTYVSSIGDITGPSAGLAYILDQFNTGISLGRVDGSGNIKKINVTKENIVVPGGNGVPKPGVNVKGCP